MNPLLVAPLLLTAIGLIAGWFLPRLGSPALCVRVLTTVTVVAAAGIISGLVLVGAAGASEIGPVTHWLGWCEALYPGDHGAAPWAGAIAVGALAVAVFGIARYGHRVRCEQHLYGGVDGVEVVVNSGAVAFAVPGSPGGVVLSHELLRTLSPDERRVVLAHERAHLELKHHKYVHAAEACAAALPLLTPLARQVRFNTERWADEAAAEKVGSRTLVARTIARVALLGQPTHLPRFGLAFGGLGASARVDALLRPHPTLRSDVPAAASAAAILVTLVGSSVQVHHLATFFWHACPV